MRQGIFAGRYPALALMVMLALIPYLALSSALSPLTPIIAANLHMSLQTMSLSSGMANAAYAVGTVLVIVGCVAAFFGASELLDPPLRGRRDDGTAVVIFYLGGARLQVPDVDRFLAGREPAGYSPPLLARLRSGSNAPTSTLPSSTIPLSQSKEAA